jgi:uncharacterized metal-binding protein YceD (DUF177 family)
MISSHAGADDVPFSYNVKVGHISANPVRIKLDANEAERAALAEFWDIVSVGLFRAELQVTRWKKDGLKVKGTVKAEIVQECVATLEDVPSSIDEEFEQIFVPEGSKLARLVLNAEGEIVVSVEGDDMPEQFTGDTIDVGSLVTEIAALAIDPYPRKDGVDFVETAPVEEEIEVKPSSFAALKDWKKS